MVESLAAQTRREEVELVFVAPVNAAIPLDAAELRMFGAAHVVEVDSVQRLAQARAVGVRAATAPLVYLAETHAFPQPGFVEEIILAHDQGWTAVVPAVENGNPGEPVVLRTPRADISTSLIGLANTLGGKAVVKAA